MESIVYLLIGVFINILFVIALSENYRMMQAGGNKIPREHGEEAKRPQPAGVAQAQAGDLLPGIEFLEDIWDTDEGKR